MHASKLADDIVASLENFSTTEPVKFAQMQSHDLAIIQFPYVVIALIVISMFVFFALKKMPQSKQDNHHSLNLKPTFLRLIKNGRYVGGVIAQTFYVGVQIMCWTYIIHYAMQNYKISAFEAQNYNILAMVLFCASRFVCTYLMKFLNAGILLLILSLIAISLLFGVIFCNSIAGIYCLVAVSACMSTMFPSIYGIALEGIGDDAKLASSGLIFAIVGGALMPPLQGWIIDIDGLSCLSSTRLSFFLPMLCFVVIGVYGYLCRKDLKSTLKN